MNRACHPLDLTINDQLPLPRRIWASWDDTPSAMTPETTLILRSPAFTLAPGESPVLYLTASGTVKMTLNGTPVELPEANEPLYWKTCRVALSPAAAAGELRLTIEAQGASRTPYVLACLDIESEPAAPGAGPRVARRVWATDEMFEVSLDKGATWQAAWAFEGVWSEPTGFPLGAPDDWARLTHGHQRVLHRPLVAVCEKANGTGRWHELGVTGDLVATTHPRLIVPRPLPWAAFNPAMFHLLREDYCRWANEFLEEQTGRAPWAVVDAGAETFGRLVLQNLGTGTIQVAVVTGESVNELHYYNRAMSGVWTLAPGERATTHLIGFRYAKIFALTATDGTFRLAQPVVQALEYGAPQRASFTCSDPLLEQVWQAGADTVRLCAQAQLWDGAKRDLLPWMGDLHIESLIWMLTTGDAELTAISLKANRDTGPFLSRPYRERQVPSLSVTWGGPDGNVNGTPSYTAWWVVGLVDYALHTGDMEYPRSELKDLLPLLEKFKHAVRDNGEWVWADYAQPMSFIDHSIIPLEVETLGMQSVVAAVFLGAGRLLGWLGESDAAASWSALGQKMVANYMERIRQHTPGQINRQAAATAGALHIMPREDVKAIFPFVEATDDNLRTPWWRGYELGTAWAAGRVDWMLAEIRRFWGDMLAHGQTSLWECHDPKWFTAEDPHRCAVTREDGGYGGHRISQCHGWAGAPTYWLLTGVLGVRPLEPGFTKIAFEPNLGDLAWAEGTIPTPHGDIKIRLDRAEDGTTRRQIEVPQGVTIAEASELAGAR